ncbi:hypothetical protein B5808_13440 [Cnuibacter physcomitrellae]|uniref:Glycosyltransferase 2-like domain-containing protein n=1 Tax=Cnuibacter physcomitrellae TaxID=1619308 RepID=A0A1X9LLR0_9MICO|nr:hypothetical protein B5808_13440 [Cnuibacter physcomitrellae]
MPQLVVLMPVRNGERTIVDAVKSTLRALPSDGELVVFNDGSSDNTMQLLSAFNSTSLRVLGDSSSSIGVAGALNALIRASDSDLVARMDADDICLPGRLKYQMSRIKRGVDVSFTNTLHFGVGLPRPSLPVQLKTSLIASLLLTSNPVAHSTMMCRRDVLEQSGGYRECMAEDYDLWLRLAASGHRLERSAVPFLAYRHHAGQVTSASNWSERAESEPMIEDARRSLAAIVYPRWTDHALRRADLKNDSGFRWVDDVSRSLNLTTIERSILLSRAKRTYPHE